jgi:hypothetical protein
MTRIGKPDSNGMGMTYNLPGLPEMKDTGMT